jgi:thioredoxin 1
MLLQAQFLILTDNNFQTEVEQTPVPVVVDCWATWCMPQHSINPVLHNLSVEFAKRIQIGRLNVAESKQSAAKYGIRAVPTLLIFSHGKVVYCTIGAASQHEIAQQLNTHMHLLGKSRSLISCS